MTLEQKIRGICAGRGYYITDVADILERHPAYVLRLYSGKSKLNLNDLLNLSSKLNITFEIKNNQIKIKPYEKRKKNKPDSTADVSSSNNNIFNRAVVKKRASQA